MQITERVDSPFSVSQHHPTSSCAL